MSREKIGRISSDDWRRNRPEALAVFSGQYSLDGQRYTNTWPQPWTVIGCDAYGEFTTHAEALAWAFEKAEAAR